MAEKFSTGFVNAEAEAVRTALANCIIGIFNGTQPATANDTEGSASLLALITVNSGSFTAGVATNGLNFNAASDGVLSKTTAIWSGNGTAAAGSMGQLATWFRVYPNAYTTGASTTAVRYDGSIGTTSTYELQMTNTTIVEGVPVVISTFSLTIKRTA